MSASIDCRQCKHYYITWDKRFPYGCRKLGFKTRRMPAVEVLQASETHCLHFDNKSNANVHKK